MLSVEKLKRLLADQGGADYWSDVLVTEAGELLDVFGNAQWQEVSASAANWPQEWRLRLAEALSGMQAPAAFDLAFALTGDPDQAVAHAAASAIRFLPLPPPGPKHDAAVARLRVLLAAADDFDAFNLNLTLEALGAQPEASK